MMIESPALRRAERLREEGEARCRDRRDSIRPIDAPGLPVKRSGFSLSYIYDARAAGRPRGFQGYGID